ncbi:ABC transporter substrate-binding protein [Sphingomonas sp. 3P27F8]|uniref:ABC transporter substrate-binding protein n=1 Tax=Sphingomonas sp. 3P27F8 TaxID=2502213 RepID=UPI0010F736AF|nr:ABC transporter substrate-binding protein [Sphingomonas sp. 3P27F8]
MADTGVKLTIAVADYPHTAAVRDGSIPIEGVDAEIVTVKPQIGAFRRMVRNLEFDVCELAPTTYIIARAYGIPITALPIFVMRNFHHRGLLVRPDAGIRTPKDLEGKKVGVRAYSVTTGVWTRQILIDDYGVDASNITWVVDDEEHVTQMPLPANVIHAPAGRSLADMMAAGELAAGFAANAGVGRSGAPTGGEWKVEEASYPELFPDFQELEADWFKRTGIWPMHGTIVVKDSVLKEHPWVARSLFEAFSQAKDDWLAALDTSDLSVATDKRYSAVRSIIGPDPLPYGLVANLPTIRALEETAFKQQLTPRRMSIDELFVDPQA